MTIREIEHPRFGTVKLGRKAPPRIQGPRLHLANYMSKVSLPAPPDVSPDYYTKAMPALRDIYMNDKLGCCVVSALNHSQGVETGNAGNLLHVPSSQIIKEYGKIGGYVDGDPSTDNGCNVEDALKYYKTTGFMDGSKILGYIAVDPRSPLQLKTATYLFENLIFGCGLPDQYISPFPSGDGFVWDVGTPNPNNGHCFMGALYNNSGIPIDTWGDFGLFTFPAISELCNSSVGGEVWTYVTAAQLLKGTKKAPNGFDWLSLVTDFDTMGGTAPLPVPDPVPVPVPVPPPFNPPDPPKRVVNLQNAINWAERGLDIKWPKGTRPVTLVQAKQWLAAGLTSYWPKP